MTASLSYCMMSWNLPLAVLDRALWTLSHQSLAPRDIVLAECSPDEGTHQAVREHCKQYPLVKVVHAYWRRFNISRGINVALRHSDPAATYAAACCADTYYSENLTEQLMAVASDAVFVRVACGTLPEGFSRQMPSPAEVRANWQWWCDKVDNAPVPIAPGSVFLLPRRWWMAARGYDEARRPYSYPDVDIQDRALRSGMLEAEVIWDKAQTLHPRHPKPMFYSISGYAIDNQGVDREITRNPAGWGDPNGDEPVRIPGT